MWMIFRYVAYLCVGALTIQFFFHRHNAVNMNEFINLAYILDRNTPANIHPPRTQLIPLPRGGYPVFNKYPIYVVDFQAKERERIQEEERQYLLRKYDRIIGKNIDSLQAKR